MEIKTVWVVGCGVMGQGIAEACARAGYRTLVSEATAELLEKGMTAIRKSVQRSVTADRTTAQDGDAINGRLIGGTQLAGFGECDLVVEAVAENMDLKKRVFSDLDRTCPAPTIFGTNTSVLSVTDIAMATKRADRVLGLHFFNPATIMKLVEIIRAFPTSDEAVNRSVAFAASLGKTPVVVKDGPGFVVNRLVIPFVLDAVRMLELGTATRDDIDRAVVLGLNHPMGPLTLLDNVGLDTALASANAMYEDLKDPHFAPPIMLKKMVASGFLGRKSGRGFYDYTKK